MAAVVLCARGEAFMGSAAVYLRHFVLRQRVAMPLLAAVTSVPKATV